MRSSKFVIIIYVFDKKLEYNLLTNVIERSNLFHNMSSGAKTNAEIP